MVRATQRRRVPLFAFLFTLAAGVALLQAASTSWAGRDQKAASRHTTKSPPVIFKAVDFQAVDHLSDESLCGLTFDGRTLCYDWKMNPIHIPDTVVGFKNPADIHASEGGVCGYDVDGVKCLHQNRAMFEMRELLNESNPKLVGAHGKNVCGVKTNDGSLRCYVPFWFNFPKPTFLVRPKKKITAIGVGSELICWTEGTVIDCQTDRGTRRFQFNNAVEILTTPNLCARSATEAKCWLWDDSPVDLAPEFLTAKKWVGDTDSTISAITSDNRLVVLDPRTGNAMPTGYANVPPIFQKADSPLVDLWMGNQYRFCASTASSTIQCWSGISRRVDDVQFPEPVVGFTAGYLQLPCALLKSGQVQCTEYWGTQLRSLPAGSRVRSLFSSRDYCHWNRRAVTCRVGGDFSALESILTVSTDRYVVDVCAIGTRPGATISEVMCRKGSSLENVPPTTFGATSLSVAGRKACAASTNGVHCWGDKLNGELPPNSFLDPVKVELTETYACALDRFGLVCWGDLSTHNLNVPSGLGDPNQVIDFALGEKRACAVRVDGKVQCWGTGSTFDEDAPPLEGVTAIYGSRQHVFCAINSTGLHCWGGDTQFPR